MAIVDSSEGTPTFLDLAREISEYLQISYQETFVETHPPIKMDSWNITLYDTAYVAVSIAFLSTLRSFLTKRVFLPIAYHYGIPQGSRMKVPGSAWYFTFFFCVWCYEWYVVVLSGKYKFFQEPESMWHGWSLETFPPRDIYTIYVFQAAYYLHGTYATMFLDAWRNDSVMMVFHHILTLVLIFISHATRCHNIGVLIMFMFDMCHVFLEFAKLCTYFKIQDNKVKEWIEMMEKVGFTCFTAIWITARLYWFTLKPIYSGVVHPRRLKLKVPYAILMNILIWTDLVFQIFWAKVIIKIFFRFASGQKLKDPRYVTMSENRSEHSPSN